MKVSQNTATKATRPAGKINLLDLIDRTNPEEQAIAFYILRDRQKRKSAESESKLLTRRRAANKKAAPFAVGTAKPERIYE